MDGALVPLMHTQLAPPPAPRGEPGRPRMLQRPPQNRAAAGFGKLIEPVIDGVNIIGVM